MTWGSRFMVQGSKVTIIKKFQITKHKYQMVRQADRQAHGPDKVEGLTTTLSQVEGQITMIEIQNTKQLAVDLI